MEELTTRQQAILAMVVREYIDKARPVASKTLVERYNLSVSPATVRNEMACLEEQGYLTHLHTSAGRMPTEKGYRYFVERLIQEVELPLAEQRKIRHQFHQIHMDLDKWMTLAAAVLAHTARCAALVTAPRTLRCRFKHLELIPLQGSLVLLILVLQGGTVKQQMLNLFQPLSQDELTRTANRLNDLCQGLEAEQIAACLPQMLPFEKQMAEVAINIIKGAEEPRDVHRYGLINILRQPEFAQVENVCQLITILEQGGSLEKILSEAAVGPGGVQVIIGGEGRWEELASYSIVLARYGAVDRAVGALGVLGPLRMPYRRAISTVRYVAGLLSDMIIELYG